MLIGSSNPATNMASEFTSDEVHPNGPFIDLYAPAENVECISNTGNHFVTQSGTSFAAPQVAGVAALLMAPEDSYPPAADLRNAIVELAYPRATSGIISGPKILYNGVWGTCGGGLYKRDVDLSCELQPIDTVSFTTFTTTFTPTTPIGQPTSLTDAKTSVPAAAVTDPAQIHDGGLEDHHLFCTWTNEQMLCADATSRII